MNNSYLINHSQKPVDIIIPIYNALDDLRDCIDSVFKYTDFDFRLILINDGSSETSISKYLNNLAVVSKNLIVIDRADNLGFIKTINEGLSLSDNDVVILNSDTRVSRNWLSKIMNLSKSRRNIATITPLTNSGTICSVPQFLQDNAIPEGFTIDSFAELIEKISFHIYPEAPTGVGFCMFISRKALNEIGLFNETLFGKGYGEENDFCQKAIALGYINLIADDTFIFHKHGASFQEEKYKLMSDNTKALLRIHPNYSKEISEFVRKNPLSLFHRYLKRVIQMRGKEEVSDARKILHVIHGMGGGMEKQVRELISDNISSDIHYIFISKEKYILVEKWKSGSCASKMMFKIRRDYYNYASLTSQNDYKTILNLCIQLFSISLIHIHHLINNSEIIEVLAKLDIPYILTLHDYYSVCPSIFLLDSDFRYCSNCTSEIKDRGYELCMKHIGLNKYSLEIHQSLMRQVLTSARRIIVPNATMVDTIIKVYPEIRNKIDVIEHGNRNRIFEYDLQKQIETLKEEKMLNVAILGNLAEHKGFHILKKILVKAPKNLRVRFVSYGLLHEKIPGVISKGRYDSCNIVEALAKDKIHIGLFLSVCPESYSYTLSEYVQAKIPVISFDLGAQGDRVRKLNAGWVVQELNDADAVLRKITDLIENRELIYEAKKNIQFNGLASIEDMQKNYNELYGNILGEMKMRKRELDELQAEYFEFIGMQTLELEKQKIELERTNYLLTRSKSFRLGYYILHPQKILKFIFK